MFNFTHNKRNTDCNYTEISFSPIRLAKIQKLDNTPHGEAVEKLAFSGIAGGNQRAKALGGWFDNTEQN